MAFLIKKQHFSISEANLQQTCNTCLTTYISLPNILLLLLFWLSCYWAFLSLQILGTKNYNKKIRISYLIINFSYIGLNQYPVFQVPAPLRDIVRFRITRPYGRCAACNKFYKDFFKCAYEVGRQLEYKECWKEYADMKECEGRQKTVSDGLPFLHIEQCKRCPFIQACCILYILYHYGL